MVDSAWKPAPPVSAPADSLVGYDDLVEIGRGGDSVVYRARDLGLSREVAIKILLVDDEVRAARFAREIDITLELGRAHPNIVTVLAVGTTGSGRPAIVMDYCDGGTLHDRLAAHGPLPVEEVATIGAVLADALSFAHGRGVLHRDVKPQNVLVLPTSWVLADFGIARLVDSEHTASVETFTYRHAAPQVLDGLPPTAADDIWSLGSTLYTLLDGRPPFASAEASEDTALAYLRRVRTEPHRPLVAPGQAALATVIERCLAKDVTDRWASAADLKQALEGLRSHAWEPGAQGVAEPDLSCTAEAARDSEVGSDRDLPEVDHPVLDPVLDPVQNPVQNQDLAWAPRPAAELEGPGDPGSLPEVPRPSEPTPIALSVLGHAGESRRVGGPPSAGQVDAAPTGRVGAGPDEPGLGDSGDDLDQLSPARPNRRRTLWMVGAAAVTTGVVLSLGRVLLSPADSGSDPAAQEPTGPQPIATLSSEPTDSGEPQPRRADPALAFDFLKLDSDGTTLALKWTDPSEGLGTFVLTQLGKQQQPVYQFPAGTTEGSLTYALNSGRTCFLLSVVLPDRSLGEGRPVRCLNR